MRRVVAKIERTPEGSQRRFVVTNLSAPADWVYREFYVKRGDVPERPIGELKNASPTLFSAYESTMGSSTARTA